MVKISKMHCNMKQIVLLLTFLLSISCSQQKYFVSKIEGKKIGIENDLSSKPDIESFIKPYREHIDADLNAVLAYCPETLEKSKGKWQTNIGCFLADITLAKANEVYTKRTGKPIDVCMLNHGGIRSIIPKGNVTARNAFEVMPFENAAIVLELNGAQIVELCNYIVAEKKPHPLAGLTFEILKNNEVKNILVQGKPLVLDAIYTLVTSDYLAGGGDNMVFFKKATQQTDLDYKLRNILIDYFKEKDTLQFNNNLRIIELSN